MSRFREPELKAYELNEYVQNFKSSADRARYVLFVSTVVSLLVLLAEWNYLHASWSRQRWDDHLTRRAIELQREWLFERRAAKNKVDFSPDERRYRALHTPVDDWTNAEIDSEVLRAQGNEFVSRMIFVSVPGIGASIHVNDLGLAGGIMLAALTGLLALSMAREHENLYLSTFKIRKLRDADPDHRNGESPANLLYHALAMVQVLNDPPTLARWNQGSRRFFSRATTAFTFLLPAIVQATVVFQNINSRQRAFEVWGPIVTWSRLGIQVTLMTAVVSFGLICFAYSVACDDRWEYIFFYVNPALRFVEQEPWLEWLRICRDPYRDRLERDIARQLTYALDVRIEPRVFERNPITIDVTGVDPSSNPIGPSWLRPRMALLSRFRRSRFPSSFAEDLGLPRRAGVVARMRAAAIRSWRLLAAIYTFLRAKDPNPMFTFTRAHMRMAARWLIYYTGLSDEAHSDSAGGLRITRNVAVIRNRKLESWSVEVCLAGDYSLQR